MYPNVVTSFPTLSESGFQQLVASGPEYSSAARRGTACRQEIRGSRWKRGHDKRDISVVRGQSGTPAERRSAKWNIIKIQG